MPLNTNQRRFLALYRATSPRNAQRAYELVYKAQGKVARDNASRLLAKASIRSALEEADAADLRDLGITAAAVLREVARVAFSDVRALFDEEGTLKSLQHLDDDLAHAIAAVDVTEWQEGDTEGATVRTRKVRLWNKVESLKLLAQYLHLLVEKVEIEVSGEVRHTWTDRLSRSHTALEERRNGRMSGDPAITTVVVK